MPNTTQQTKQVPPPYSTQPGNYNRAAGNKTLVFVGIMIALIVILSIIVLVMINTKSSVLIK